MGKHKDRPLKSRHRGFYAPFSTLIHTVFGAFGEVTGAGHQHRPETLLAVVDTSLADLIILPPAIPPKEEGPFQPPFFTPAHGSPCSGASRSGRPFSGGLRSEHSFFASSSRSRMEGFFSVPPFSAASFAFSTSSPRLPLLITPSIMP